MFKLEEKEPGMMFIGTEFAYSTMTTERYAMVTNDGMCVGYLEKPVLPFVEFRHIGSRAGCELKLATKIDYRLPNGKRIVATDIVNVEWVKTHEREDYDVRVNCKSVDEILP